MVPTAPVPRSRVPPAAVRPLVRRWFEAHWVPTDGAFSRRKSAHEKRHGTVVDLVLLYDHFIRHGLGADDVAPDVIAFAHALQSMFGVRVVSLTKNRWVGTVKRAVTVRPRGDGLPPRREGGAAAVVGGGPGLFEEFRRRVPSAP